VVGVATTIFLAMPSSISPLSACAAAAAFYWISRSFRSEAQIARTKTKLA